ncbi:MAG TPA: DUF1223 domain-containing protein [Caulobacteraceae bacterium]|nr:DUF1223 domain-containing protein [Caulobacteraceae bacterium]
MKSAHLAPCLIAAVLAASTAVARPLVVVELYTAQGCGSCGKADALAAGLADHAGLTALTFNVDYWDYLGWKDTFAQSEFADRQRAYDKRFGLRDVYTPQVIIDGIAQASGDNPAEIDRLIRAARRARVSGPDITPRADGTVAVMTGRAPRGGDDVWLIRYDPRTQSVVVKDGETKGQTLAHRNVVRQLIKLGDWTGKRRVFHLPAAKEEGLETLILVQAPNGGRIVGALRQAPKA